MIEKINLFYNFYDSRKFIRVAKLKLLSISHFRNIRVFTKDNIISFNIKNSKFFDCYMLSRTKKLLYHSYD